jgi:hypothetical protein
MRKFPKPSSLGLAGNSNERSPNCSVPLVTDICIEWQRKHSTQASHFNKLKANSAMMWRRASLRKLPVLQISRRSSCSSTFSSSPASDSELLGQNNCLQVADCRGRMHTEPVLPSALFEISAPLRISTRTYEEVCSGCSCSSISSTFQSKQRQKQQLTLNCGASSFKRFNEHLASVASTDACEGESFSAEFDDYDERLSGEVFELEL